jgi:hypothetical protein
MAGQKQKRVRRRQQRDANKAHVESCIALAKEVSERDIPLQVSRKEIFAARTPAGGWTRKTLAAWGVSWPPRQGWIDRLVAGIPEETWDDVDHEHFSVTKKSPYLPLVVNT